MRLLIIIYILLLQAFPALANGLICQDSNVFAQGLKFDNGIVKVYLDQRFNDYFNEPELATVVASQIDIVIQELSNELVNIQLEIIQTDEKLGINDLAQPCHGLPSPAIFECIDEKREEQRVKYKNGIILTVGSNSGSLRQYCSNGEAIDSNNPCEDTIMFGNASIGINNVENYGSDTSKDIIRHELMHALGLPHVYGPYQIQGFFDFQATATPSQGSSWKRYRVPNMDPIINTVSHGLKRTDIQNIQDKYGHKENSIIIKVNLVTSYGSPAEGMNVALLHKNRHIDKSTARSTYGGSAYLSTTRGKYFILVRPVPVAKGANLSSGVEGERSPTYIPSSTESLYVCKRDKKTKVYTLCNNPKKKKAIKLKKDREITVELLNG